MTGPRGKYNVNLKVSQIFSGRAHPDINCGFFDVCNWYRYYLTSLQYLGHQACKSYQCLTTYHYWAEFKWVMWPSNFGSRCPASATSCRQPRTLPLHFNVLFYHKSSLQVSCIIAKIYIRYWSLNIKELVYLTKKWLTYMSSIPYIQWNSSFPIH